MSTKKATTKSAGKDEDNPEVEVLQSKIDSWKKLHGEVFLLTLEGADPIYIRKPDRKTVGLAMSLGAGNQVETALELIKACLLHGDIAPYETPEAAVSLVIQLDAIVETKLIEVKSL